MVGHLHLVGAAVGGVGTVGVNGIGHERSVAIVFILDSVSCLAALDETL